MSEYLQIDVEHTLGGLTLRVACTLSAGMARFKPQRIVSLLFPPISERDLVGVEELENQTRNLLAFREVGSSSFDAQIAFNLLAAYGEEGKPRLQDIRAEISREVAFYIAGRAPVPAIQLVQAPVFYGYSFAAYAEFDPPGLPDQLQISLANLGVKIA